MLVLVACIGATVWLVSTLAAIRRSTARMVELLERSHATERRTP